MKKMMKLIKIQMVSLWLIVGFTACQQAVTDAQQLDEWPKIYPDYVGVTIPATIAPMNFVYQGGEYEWVDVQVKGGKEGTLHVNDDRVALPSDEWQALLQANRQDSLLITLSVKQQGKWKQYRPFPMYVSGDSIDYGVVYRRIAPGYEVYSKMGIYERNLSNFDERPLLENTLVPGMCVNCHALNRANPNRLSLHIRGQHGATMMQVDDQRELLNTQTDSTLSACVYPYWHPSGDYIAYSVNTTRQSFHVVKDERVEVLDLASDVLVYHPQTHTLLRSPLLERKDAFETFPVFSPDGRTLYFCSAVSRPVPEEYDKIRYNLCRIDFHPEEGTFGHRVDTLIHAEAMQQSVSFPRPSYDGKYLMYTLSKYGNFSIWHKEADLWLLNLEDGTTTCLDQANSEDTESFHNWSSNNRWFLFSSRRGDGLYTRLYLCHIDEAGRTGKPFLLPQEDPWEYYDRSVYSYNVPDFTNTPIKWDTRAIEREIVSDKRVPVQVRP